MRNFRYSRKNRNPDFIGIKIIDPGIEKLISEKDYEKFEIK